uniref:Uncharacterized protein n=1 Tax=Knipowitschia caucasica TaxID=637954 RepID=A0AAV2L3Y9_KNICA
MQEPEGVRGPGGKKWERCVLRRGGQVGAAAAVVSRREEERRQSLICRRAIVGHMLVTGPRGGFLLGPLLSALSWPPPPQHT